MAIEWCEAVSEYGVEVDIDELLSDLQGNEEWAGKNGHLELQDNLQNAIMAIAAMRYELDKRWIPCSEKLPKVDCKVLICDKTIENPYEGCLMKNGEWTDYDFYIEPENVTHWMPLPKKPKKEDEQNG
jgi:hypothetical protein